MSNSAKATAAPVTVEVDGKIWTATPLTFAMLAEFEGWAEEDLLRQARRVLPADEAGKAIPRGGEATAAMLQTMRGRLRLAWIVLRDKHDLKTPDDLTAAGLTAAGMTCVVNAALDAAFPEAAPAREGAPEGKPFRSENP